MRVVGKEGALEGGVEGGRVKNENYVMDGQKDNDVLKSFRTLTRR